ncbi:MAG: hypothetical protein ACYC5O_02020 [Anaerolineae bacterium]
MATEGTQGRLIRHFGIHRIGKVELRVISDISEGVTGITELEEAVLCRYMQLPNWPHRVVSLFVLSDLGPLQRQLTRRLPSGADSRQDVSAVASRPVVNLYDLADLSACHVFVQQAAMTSLGYWGDTLAETGLLAHEHAHPLAESSTVRSTRQLTLDLRLDYRESLGTADGPSWQAKLLALCRTLVDKLCLEGPREVLADDVVLRGGFSAALHHLGLANLRSAAEGVRVRPGLVAGLAAQPTLSDAGRAAFLALADFGAHLDHVLAIAPFWRCGEDGQALSLERVLAEEVFPTVVPQAGPAYVALSQLYRGLPAESSPAELAGFARQVASVLAAGLEPYGVLMHVDIGVEGNR